MAQCKEPAYNAGDVGSVPGLGTSPGEGNCNPLQFFFFFFFFLENPMNRGAWCVTVYGVTKRVRLSDYTTTNIYIYIYTHT